jgi:membrane-associated phospholipid phosphatase
MFENAKPWRFELVLFLLAYLVYNAARWVFVGDLDVAKDHAHWIVDLEQDLGVYVESSVQAGLDGAFAASFLSNVYMAAQLVVLPGALIWLYRRNRGVYRGLRNTVLWTWMLSVPIYALFPTAPPRLAGIGMTDTVSEQTVSLTGASSVFYNPLAAVPSLHVGFAAAIAVAVAAALHRRWAKWLALSWGPLVTLSVVATGNHYLFDAAAGLLITWVGYLAGRRVQEVAWPLLAVRRSVSRSVPAAA